jgi:hypothetical protein
MEERHVGIFHRGNKCPYSVDYILCSTSSCERCQIYITWTDKRRYAHVSKVDENIKRG